MTSLHRRDIHFDTHQPIPAHWFGNQCQLTRFYDAMSIMFPEGERAFIETVQYFRLQIHDNPALTHEIAEFIAQEALHSREHVRFNRRLETQGLPLKRLERRIAAQQDFARRHLLPELRLAITICLEHFTAIFANQVLRDPRNLAGAHPIMADLWLWHALEESEHKAVAFDVFTAAVRGPLRRYALRCATMLFVTPVFITTLWSMTFQMTRCDNQAWSMHGWLKLLHRQFIAPAPLVRLFPQWAAWFLPGFHPWQHDNRALVERFARQFDHRSH